MSGTDATPTPAPERPSRPDQRPTSRLGTVRAIWRIYPFAKKALPRICLGVGAALIGALVALSIPMVLEKLVNGALAENDASAIWPAVGLVLALGIVEAVMIALRRWFVLLPGTTVEATMRNRIYAQLQDLPVAFHDRWQSGQLLSRMMQDLGLIRRWLSFGVVMLAVNVLTIIVGSVILFWWHWMLGLIFLLCAIPVWIYGYVFEQKYRVVARRSQDQAGDLATAVEESVHGIRVLKAFGRGRHALAGFSNQAESLRGTEIEKAKAIGGIWFWLILLPDIAFGLCLVAGIWLAAQGQLNVGQLFGFFAAATVLRAPIESIGFLLSMTFDARTAVDRIFEVLDERNTITDPEDPVTIANPQGRLTFDDVHFRYGDAPAGERDIVDGANLVVEPGETMALVGLTGCGKTTLTALTTRIYDVTAGAVRLDGVDVRDLHRLELRRHIAMAFEEATLFSSTVRENVLLGRDELDPHSERAQRVLDEAIAVAQAQFVHELPQGVETTVGEEGLSLSGGQRQRLALARAVAAAPAVLVLDDPLSALDVDTEALVEDALRKVLASTTALIVAHRPSTVALADRVALMQDGRIVDVGTHTELLSRNAHYRFVISSLDEQQEENSRMPDEERRQEEQRREVDR